MENKRIFPSLEWFKAYQRFLEQDEDFKKHCRWFKGAIIFRVDQQSFLLKFDYGMIADVSENYGDYDVMINGPLERWKLVFAENMTLNKLYRLGVLGVKGNPIEIMKNWKALFHIVQGLKKVGIN